MKDLRISPTPYDDVFRTLLNDCSSLIIPLINEAFGEHYRGDEKILFSPNEHYLNQQGGGEEKRITDTNFVVVGTLEKRYHLECESRPDSGILVRIFEYDAQIALDQGSELQESRIIVSFPNTAVLALRSTSGTPGRMEIVIRTPGGEILYKVPVIRVKDYSVEEIFGKKLLFLIPFHIFAYESMFPKIERDPEKLVELRDEYKDILDRLEGLAEKGMIGEYY